MGQLFRACLNQTPVRIGTFEAASEKHHRTLRISKVKGKRSKVWVQESERHSHVLSQSAARGETTDFYHETQELDLLIKGGGSQQCTEVVGHDRP